MGRVFGALEMWSCGFGFGVLRQGAGPFRSSGYSLRVVVWVFWFALRTGLVDVLPSGELMAVSTGFARQCFAMYAS